MCTLLFLFLIKRRKDPVSSSNNFLFSWSWIYFHCLCLTLLSHTLMHYCFSHICVCLFVCIDVCIGGEGKVGKVVDIRGWDTESGRSVASVTWSNGTTNVYRMGHKGKVDLKYVSDSQGGFYYKDHLPKLGKTDYFKICISSTASFIFLQYFTIYFYICLLFYTL